MRGGLERWKRGKASEGVGQAVTYAFDGHLAYASTVHGIQGETVDRSYVGPGVNAAGLYVGMTRGRRTNIAITIARDRHHAIEQLADIMMRGRIEVTLDDARRGSLVELGRAARPAPDRLETALEAEREARACLLEIDMRVALADAASHARRVAATTVLLPSAVERGAAQAKLGEARQQVATLFLHRARVAVRDLRSETAELSPPVAGPGDGMGL